MTRRVGHALSLSLLCHRGALGDIALNAQPSFLASEPRSQSSPPFGHPDESKTYPTYEDFTLYLVEEFNEPLELDNDAIWTYSDGALNEGSIRFKREGITFKDGSMFLTAEEMQECWGQEKCSYAEAGEVNTERSYRSGELRTKHNMFRYGRYEVRMKAPTIGDDPETLGNYIATMFAYRDGKFRAWREIDIEVLGDSYLYSNVLAVDNTTIFNERFAAGDKILKDKTIRTEFHTYAFEWLPNRIRWYYDGVMFREYTDGLPENENKTVFVPDLSTKIMMSLWIWDQGQFPCPPDQAPCDPGYGWWFGGSDGANNVFPMAVEYDWFRFYKWDNEDTYPCANMGTECLTEDDMYLSKNNPCDGIDQLPVNGDEFREEVCQTATCIKEDDPASCPADPDSDSSTPWIWMILGGTTVLCALVAVGASYSMGTNDAGEGDVQLASS